MKPIALNELQEAVRNLTFTAGNLNPDNIEEVREDIRRAVSNINAAIFAETPNTSKKFDLYKFTYKDENVRPIMCGVHHQEGFKVASDCHVLVAVKEPYAEDLEGQTLDKTGNPIQGKYPRWQELFPKKEKGVPYKIDTEKVYELLRAVKAEKKAAGKWGKSRRGYVKVGDTFFAVEKMALLCTFMDAVGSNEITIYDPRRAAAVYAPDGSEGLIMPVRFLDYYEGDNAYETEKQCEDVWEKHKDGALWYVAA